jgi:hypothetical protein
MSHCLYHPVEEAFLCDFFGITRPEHLKDVDIYDSRLGVHLEHQELGKKLELSNAVARLGLSQVQERLPNWCMFSDEGVEVIGRTVENPVARGLDFIPQHLFTINWADSGPGISWPEAYHLIWFPQFDRYVVTASNDTTDAWGVTDRAVGHCPGSADRIQAAHKIVTKYWRDECGPEDTDGWAYLFDSGIIDESDAYDWRNEVFQAKYQDPPEDPEPLMKGARDAYEEAGMRLIEEARKKLEAEQVARSEAPSGE